MNATELKVFWDTNLWVYLFDSASPKKQDQIRRLLKQDHNSIITPICSFS